MSVKVKAELFYVEVRSLVASGSGALPFEIAELSVKEDDLEAVCVQMSSSVCQKKA